MGSSALVYHRLPMVDKVSLNTLSSIVSPLSRVLTHVYSRRGGHMPRNGTNKTAPARRFSPARGRCPDGGVHPSFLILNKARKSPARHFGLLTTTTCMAHPPFQWHFCVDTPLYPVGAENVHRACFFPQKAHFGARTSSRLPVCSRTSAPPGSVSLLAPSVASGTRRAFCRGYFAPVMHTPSTAPSSGKREK